MTPIRSIRSSPLLPLALLLIALALASCQTRPHRRVTRAKPPNSENWTYDSFGGPIPKSE